MKLKFTDYKSIKNIIFNFFEQNVQYRDNKLKQIPKEKIFLLLLYKLTEENVIHNPILCKLISSGEIANIEELDSLFSFVIDKQFALPGVISKTQNKAKKKEKGEFKLSINAESNYQNLIYNYPEICSYIKEITIQIMNSISFSGSKIPTSPIKFKNFVNSLIRNQKFLRLIDNFKQKPEDVIQIVTEGIIVDFIKLGMISFPKETKIQYHLNIIEREKYRLSIQKSSDA